MNVTARVTDAMTDYFAGDVRRINHFLKVYAFAKTIGEQEGLGGETQRILEIAALTHDIGIRNSEIKYRSSAGAYQQVEGPPEAEKLLSALAVNPAVIRRVCWLIARHHTYADIQGADYQILVEADFLVNIYEDGLDAPAVRSIERTIFKTASGKAFLRRLYLPETSGKRA
jgi:HD superfamily phosphodiesterase